MIENDRWCISVYFSRTWRLKSQDIGRFWRRCCSLPPMHLHVAGNSSPWIRLFQKIVKFLRWGTHNKNSKTTCFFFKQKISHHSRCTSNKSLSNAVAAWKTCQTCCCFFLGGFLRLKAVRSNQSQLCWELWSFIVFFGRSRRRRKNWGQLLLNAREWHWGWDSQ